MGIAGTAMGIAGAAMGIEQATIMDSERKLLKEALADCNWNKSKAALQLGIARSTIYEKIKRYGIVNPADNTR
jgi:transcriptional regulator of acetoin/glycerol metabolism